MMITEYSVELLVADVVTTVGGIDVAITLPAKHLGLQEGGTGLSKLTFNVLMPQNAIIAPFEYYWAAFFVIYTSVAHVLYYSLKKHAYRYEGDSSLVTITALPIHFDSALFAKQSILAARTLSRIFIRCQNAEADSTLDQV